jgi:putative endonuclease
MVRCRDGSLYTGIATDIARRFAEHQSGMGAKYLRGRTPLILVYKKRIGSRSLALTIERIIKRMPKERKERIVSKRTNLDLLLFTRK